ncbi:MAG: hypothetical protein PHU85_04630 [Phycisphaerae bacterium]|nr:hypothetical protein [Phycisphaerae bacterium]
MTTDASIEAQAVELLHHRYVPKFMDRQIFGWGPWQAESRKWGPRFANPAKRSPRYLIQMADGRVPTDCCESMAMLGV